MEQDRLVYLGVFALIGILLKLVILFNVSIKSKIAQSFVVVCVMFLLQNVSEFLAYFTYLSSEQLSSMFIHIYLNTLYFIFPSILILALTLVEFKHLTVAKITLYGMASIVALGHLGGYVVEGVDFLHWTAVIVHGEFYWLAMGFIVLNVMVTLIVLVANNMANSNFEIRNRCRVNLLAFTPIFLVACLVLLFKLAGFNSSSAVSLPLATVFFLFVMLLQTNGNIFWASLRLKILLSVITLKNINTLDEILGSIEKLRITEALRASNGMQRNAAKLLSIPPSTLNKKIAKYNINAEDYQGMSVVEAIRSRSLTS